MTNSYRHRFFLRVLIKDNLLISTLVNTVWLRWKDTRAYLSLSPAETVVAPHNSIAAVAIVDHSVQLTTSHDKRGRFSRCERAFCHNPALLSCPTTLAVFLNPACSQMHCAITMNLESRVSVRCLLAHASPSTPTMAERIENERE